MHCFLCKCVAGKNGEYVLVVKGMVNPLIQFGPDFGLIAISDRIEQKVF